MRPTVESNPNQAELNPNQAPRPCPNFARIPPQPPTNLTPLHISARVKMSVEMVDGIRVIKLQDEGTDHKAKAEDMRTVAYLFQLLSGGQQLRDGTVFERQVL
jgi:hypothetical protein